MTITEDSSGGVWFGTHGAPEGGLSRYADGAFQYWTTSNGLPHANVLALMLDDSGRIWAGCGKDTVGGAIILSEKNGSWEIEESLPIEKLAGPIVRSLFVDRRGYTWIGSEFSGLTIRKDNETLRILTPDDGLSSGEVLTMRDTDNGTMWIGTLMGALRIDAGAVSLILTTSPD